VDVQGDLGFIQIRHRVTLQGGGMTEDFYPDDWYDPTPFLSEEEEDEIDRQEALRTTCWILVDESEQERTYESKLTGELICIPICSACGEPAHQFETFDYEIIKHNFHVATEKDCETYLNGYAKPGRLVCFSCMEALGGKDWEAKYGSTDIP
jgi:hypothetical protein